MRAGIKTTCSLIILAMFIIVMALLLIKAGKLDSTKHIKAISYPRETIIANQRPCFVVEIRDYVNDTVYFDTIPINTSRYVKH